MYPHAASSALAAAISILGLLAAVAWLVWRFGPTLMRLVGWCSWWVAWACGSQGGYGYCAALLLVGTLAWGAGTLWYARRRGHWPSPPSLTSTLLISTPIHLAMPRARRRGFADTRCSEVGLRKLSIATVEKSRRPSE